MPYKEIDHTADWALNVWADSLVELLCEAARGMNLLSGTKLLLAPRQTRPLTIDGMDAESLLVNFLSELLFYGENERLAFDTFDLKMDDFSLRGQVLGATIASQEKEIKAVTYHHLMVTQTERGWETTIVFDV
jgi:SHS2 domain-containing protein